jgi:hypothetical protein
MSEGECEVDGLNDDDNDLVHEIVCDVVCEGVEMNEAVGVTLVNDVVLDGVRESDTLVDTDTDGVGVYELVEDCGDVAVVVRVGLFLVIEIERNVGVGVGGGVMVDDTEDDKDCELDDPEKVPDCTSVALDEISVAVLEGPTDVLDSSAVHVVVCERDRDDVFVCECDRLWLPLRDNVSLRVFLVSDLLFVTTAWEGLGSAIDIITSSTPSSMKDDGRMVLQETAFPFRQCC